MITIELKETVHHVLMFQVYIWMDLAKLQDQGQITIPEVIFDIPKVLNDPSSEGALVLRDVTLSGLDTMTRDLNNIKVVETEDPDTFDVCVKLPVEYLNFTTKYVADIGMSNGEIPIYGDGNFSIHFSDITINTCMMARYKEYVDKLDFEIDYRHGPAEISGAFKHPDADKLVSKVLKIANVFLAMWNGYEPKKTSCLASPLVQYLVNWHLNYEKRSLKFNWTCLQSSAFDEVLSLSEELRWEILNFLRPHAITTRDYLLGLNNNVADYVAILNRFI